MASATATRGAFVLACYGAGLAVAFFAVGLALGGATSLFRQLRPYYDTFSSLAAALTVSFGAVLALGEGWRLNAIAAHILGHL